MQTLELLFALGVGITGAALVVSIAFSIASGFVDTLKGLRRNLSEDNHPDPKDAARNRD